MEIVTKKKAKPLTGSLLAIAHRAIYPFLMLKLEKIKKGTTPPTILRVKVDDESYNYLTKAYGTDELIVYLNPGNGKMEVWTPGMHSAFRAMEELGLMKSTREWLQKARPFLKRMLPEFVKQLR